MQQTERSPVITSFLNKSSSSLVNSGDSLASAESSLLTYAPR